MDGNWFGKVLELQDGSGFALGRFGSVCLPVFVRILVCDCEVRCIVSDKSIVCTLILVCSNSELSMPSKSSQL